MPHGLRASPRHASNRASVNAEFPRSFSAATRRIETAHANRLRASSIRARPPPMFTRDHWQTDRPNERVDGCPPMGGVLGPTLRCITTRDTRRPPSHLRNRTNGAAARSPLGRLRPRVGTSLERRHAGKQHPPPLVRFYDCLHAPPAPRSVRRFRPGSTSAGLSRGVRSVARTSTNFGLAQDHAGLLRPGLHGPLAGVRRVVSEPGACCEPGQRHRGRPGRLHQQPARAECGGARETQPAQGGRQVHASPCVAPADPHRWRARRSRTRRCVVLPKPLGRYAAAIP